jgi:hypothetical protein
MARAIAQTPGKHKTSERSPSASEPVTIPRRPPTSVCSSGIRSTDDEEWKPFPFILLKFKEVARGFET